MYEWVGGNLASFGALSLEAAIVLDALSQLKFPSLVVPSKERAEQYGATGCHLSESPRGSDGTRSVSQSCFETA